MENNIIQIAGIFICALKQFQVSANTKYKVIDAHRLAAYKYRCCMHMHHKTTNVTKILSQVKFNRTYLYT